VYVSLMHLRTFCVRVRPTVQIYTLSLHDALPIFGLVTNMTGVNERLVPAIDLFFDHPDIELTALFGPEHGIRGDAKEGEDVTSFTDLATNLPVYSLYGETRKPTADMMENVDVMVFDLQDIGSRYYTYIYTMAHVMEACVEYNKEFV